MNAPTDTADWRTLESFSFGDSSAMADELGALVVAGTKTATCWDVGDGQQTHVGKRMLMLDGAKRPWAVLETLELAQRRWCDVDAAFARDEGEGDQTLDDWRDGHRDYFSRHGHFAEDMPLWCERFRVVQVLEREGGR